MTTKKDGTTNENIDRNKAAQEDWESHHTAGDRYPEDAKGIAETDVKDAHAAGDGAFGKNDTGLVSSDPDTGEEKKDEPPY
jgi:hypothetical protein